MELLVEFKKKNKNKRKGKIFLVSGPTASGKTTIEKEILKEDLGLTFIPSFVTRKMRPHESQGNPYIFLSEKEFRNKIKSNEMFEYEEVHKGVFYGTHKNTYLYAVENGYDVIKDVDVNGAKRYKDSFKENVVTIFIKTTDLQELKRRLVKRHSETKSQIKSRLDRVDYELSKAHEFDYVVVNDDLDKAVNEIKEIIRKEKNK